MNPQQRLSGAICPVDLVRRYGGPVSHAALDPHCREFQAPTIEGLIGFVLVGRCAVVYGDPIAPPLERGRLAEQFALYCAARGWSLLYLGAAGAWLADAGATAYGVIEFADLLTGNPQQDPEAGHEGRHLRQNLNHVRRLGVTIREYAGTTSPDPGLEAKAESVYTAWRTSRSGPQMYLGRFPLFANRSGRRWFVAERGNELIGLLSLLRVDCGAARFLINLVFCAPGAPLHTADLLVVGTLKALRLERVNALAFGIGPRGTLGQVSGFGSITECLARGTFRLAARAMHLSGKTRFWEKYGITRREPLYLLFHPPRLGVGELLALGKALHFAAS